MIDNANREYTAKNSMPIRSRMVGPKPPFKLREIWAIRIRLQLENQVRNLALFNLAIDSKLRGCDLVKIQVHDITHSGNVLSRAAVIQQKNWAASKI